MFSYHLKASGSLFDKSTTPKTILLESLKETADWAENRIRGRTPVRTGRLKAGWYLIPGKNYIAIDNPTSYTKYVEKRVGMVSKTVPEVKEKLNETISIKLSKIQ